MNLLGEGINHKVVAYRKLRFSYSLMYLRALGIRGMGEVDVEDCCICRFCEEMDFNFK